MAMGNDRGSYGANAGKSGGAALPIVLVLGCTALIYGISPGARHWYKHGRLPAAEDTTQWRHSK